MQLVYTKEVNTNKKNVVKEVVLSLIFTVSMTKAFFAMFSIPISWHDISGSIGGSFIFVWNSIANVLGRNEFLFLNQYETESENGFMFFIILCLILWGINFLIIKNRIKFFLLFYSIPFLLLPLIWNLNVEPISYSAFICALSVFYAYILIDGRLNVESFVVMILLMIMIIVLSVAISNIYSHPDIMEIADKNIKKTIYEIRYGGTLLGGENLTSLSKRKNSDTDALKITMDAPDSLYLRGFVGSRLSSTGWENFDNSKYYDESALFYWLRKYNFSGFSQLNMVNELTGGSNKQNRIVVENTGTDRSHIYMPYETNSIVDIDGTNYSDSFIKANGLIGSEEYTYEISQNLVKQWPVLAAKIFTLKNDDAVADYKKLESHYNVNMYESYTDISSNHKQVIGEALGGSENLVTGHIEYKKAIERIRSYLEENFVYTETINAAGDDDFIENFLKSKKGYDVHYASAATVMFRYYGIPARYVEGYLITPEDVADRNEASTIEIGNNRLHAWTEIYVDTLGWIPLEVTPEYYGVMDEPDMSKGLENIASENPIDEEESAVSESEEGQPKEDETEIFTWFNIFILLLLLPVLIVLILLGRFFIKKMIVRIKRARAFRQQDNRKAVCAMYSYMLESFGHLEDEVTAIGDKAAYSRHTVTADDRKLIKMKLKKMEGRGNAG